MAVSLSVCAADMPAPKPEKEHEWLKQLVGEWETEGEAIMAPGQEPMKFKGTESIRMLGVYWLINESKTESMGQAVTGVLTLGFSAEKKKIVGTWIDSCFNYLWQYQGTLDEAKKTLTLESEGPGHEPGKMCKFRETIELKSADHKVFTSSMEKDGKWVVFLTVNAKRKK
ncbi:MAG TPA: DUF1579 domain-containing protein [Planctomycetota bacterium]|nr:DUF1579 domain-containing protein [Planctomycetota bacterium]